MNPCLKFAFILALAIPGFCAQPGEEVRKGKVLDRAASKKIEGVNETHLMLDVQNAPLNKVLSMLREMSGTSLDAGPVADMPKANVTEQNIVLLNALKKVCVSTNMTLDKASPGAFVGYQLVPGDDLWKLPTCDMGWAMIFAKDVNKHGNIMFATAAAANNTSDTTINLLMITERNKPIIRHSGIAQVDEALTDKGESLIQSNQNEPELNQYSRSMMPFMVKIKNAPPGSKLKSLKGKVYIALEEKAEPWIIEYPFGAEKKTKEVAGLETLTFDRQNTGQRSFTLSMTAPTQGGRPRPLLLSPELIQDRVELLDANDQKINITGRISSSSSSSSNGVTIYSRFTLNFQSTGNENVVKLKILLPAEVKAAVVPFEFHDLELP